MTSIVTLEDFKPYLKVTRGADVADDDSIQAALDSASEALNEECQRAWVVATTATARTFDPSGSSTLRIPDCTTVTGVSLDGVTFSLASLLTLPTMRTSLSGGARPIEELYRPYGGFYPNSPLSVVTVTATWGWSAIPARVTEACKILAKDILANRDVTFGIAGFTEYAGVRARENPQVMNLIGRLKRSEAFGIA